MAFVANLFNNYPGLNEEEEPVAPEEIITETREEKSNELKTLKGDVERKICIDDVTKLRLTLKYLISYQKGNKDFATKNKKKTMNLERFIFRIGVAA